MLVFGSVRQRAVLTKSYAFKEVMKRERFQAERSEIHGDLVQMI